MCYTNCSGESFLPLLRHLGACQIKRCQQQLIRAGRLQYTRCRTDTLCGHAPAACEQHGGLCQRAEQFMRTLRREIRPCRHRGRRQLFRKRKVRSMCRICKQHHIMCVEERRDGREFCRHTVIRRIDEECRTRLGVLPHDLLHRVQRYAHCDSEPRVDQAADRQGAPP